MTRLASLIFAALLLAGCRPIAAALPTPTPSPEAAFDAAYAGMVASYSAISARMQGNDLNAKFNDPAFRAEVQRLAQDWRTASSNLRYMPQPPGEKWERAWPRIQDAMAEYIYLASLIEAAAQQNNPFILIPGQGRLQAAAALLNEAMEILGRQ